MQEMEITDPKATQDSEQQSLPSQGPAIESACDLFIPEESEPSEDDQANDLENIIGSCLKEAKRNNTPYAIKSLSHLVAVSEYVKLRARYRNIKTCKRPCLSASIAIARRMGKGPYIRKTHCLLSVLFRTFSCFFMLFIRKVEKAMSSTCQNAFRVAQKSRWPFKSKESIVAWKSTCILTEVKQKKSSTVQY